MDATKCLIEYKDQILYRYYFGLISVEDIKDSWLTDIKQKLIPSETIGFVQDYRLAHFDFEPGRCIEVDYFYQSFPEVFGKKRIAFITEHPDDMVYPMLIQLQDKGYESMPFSTMKAAVQWIGKSVHYKMVEPVKD